MTVFSFDTGFQRAIIRLMMVDDSFMAHGLKWIEPGYFTSEVLGWMFRLTEWYWEHYQARLTDMVLRAQVRKLPEDKAMRYQSEAERVIALGNVPESDYIKEQVAEFVKQAIFAKAHQRSAELFNADKKVESYDVMMRAMERVQDVSFHREDRIWFFDTLTERNRERIRGALTQYASCFSTGIRQLDDLTDGGVHLGELWAVMAYAKRGKSTWLINQGAYATRVHRQPTVHFVLEGRGQQIANRYDAWFSHELYNRIKLGDIDPDVYQRLQQEYLYLRKLLVIRTLNDWNINIFDIEKELHYLKTQGFDPSMMIVDYMDLGRSRDRVDSEMQHQINFSRDLKRLVNKRMMACWSAWQAQRPREGAHEKEHVLTSSNVADAYAKVRIVDAYGSLNATDEEMNRGEMRLFWEGHRDAPVNKLWRITNDLSRMQMITSAQEYDPNEADSGESPSLPDGTPGWQSGTTGGLPMVS